jgi:hypothetical protein
MYNFPRRSRRSRLTAFRTTSYLVQSRDVCTWICAVHDCPSEVVADRGIIDCRRSCPRLYPDRHIEVVSRVFDAYIGRFESARAKKQQR